ncbi:Flp pilus assembly protein TadB [Arthrobacter ulcerisalmonis]|nr:Flp pilus assembly protein TadB [Arthrobacter ulcerisalmonis]
MNLIVLLSVLLVCLPIGALAWSVLTVDKQGRLAATDLLSRGAPAIAAAPAGASGRLEALGRRLTPPAYVAFLDRLLALAGRPASMPLGKVLGSKLALGLAGVAMGGYLAGVGSSPLMKLAGLFVLFLGYFIPDLLLYSKGVERQKAMQLELANTLDQMLISVEAGLGFEGAMARAGDNGKGPLAEELVRTLQDMQVGRSRRESYIALAERTNIPELRSFVQAVVQADTYGIAIRPGPAHPGQSHARETAPTGRGKGPEAARHDSFPALVLYLSGPLHCHSGAGRDQHGDYLQRAVRILRAAARLPQGFPRMRRNRTPKEFQEVALNNAQSRSRHQRKEPRRGLPAVRGRFACRSRSGRQRGPLTGSGRSLAVN